MEKNLYIDASHPDETRIVLKSNNSIEEYSKGILKLIDIDLNLAESWNSSDYSMSKQTELVKQIILEK